MASVGVNTRRAAGTSSPGVATQTFTIASYTPVANKLLLMMVWGYSNTVSSVPQPTITDNSGSRSWTFKAVSSYDPSNKGRLFLFTCVDTSKTPAAGTVTIDFGAGTTVQQAGWGIPELNNALLSNNGGDAILQTASATQTAGTTLTGSLSAFLSSVNLTMNFYFVFINANPTYSGGTMGMTFGGAGVANPTGDVGYGNKNNDAAPQLVWVGSSSGVMLSMEVAGVPGGSSRIVNQAVNRAGTY